MKNIITIILLLTISGLAFSQNDKADAEFQLVKKEYTLNQDGSVDYYYTKELKLLSHYSFHRLYGETFIVYNTEFQTLKINEAYTIMANGKKVVTPQNAFNEVLPRFANNAPAYNHIREMVVTHTGLEIGTVIHLEYTIHSKNGFYSELMFDETLTESSPVEKLEIRVNVPESKTLNYKLLNMAGEPTVLNENNLKTYVWKFSDLPANSKDSYQLKGHLDARRLLASTANDFNAAYSDFINQESFNFETGDCIDKCLKETSCSKTDQLSVVLDLQKIVTNDLNNLNIPSKYTGFKFRSPTETWKSNQGTQLEKVMLLCALLKKSDIKASPVVIIPNSMYDSLFGNLATFTQFAVLVEPEGSNKMLISADKVDKQCIGFQQYEKTIVVLDKDKPELMAFKTKDNTSVININGNMHFTKEGIAKGRFDMLLEKSTNPYLAFFNDDDVFKSLIKGAISKKDIKSAKIVEISLKNSRMQFEIDSPEALKAYNSYLSFELPHANNGVDSWHINLLPEERDVALEIGGLIHEKYQYSLSYGEGLKPVVNPTNIEIKNEVGSINISFENGDGHLIVTREIKLNKKILTPSDYAAFKAIMDEWNTKKYTQVIFKKE